MTEDREILFRYDRDYDGYALMKLPVLRRTRRGAWVDFYGKEKFVLGGARKRFAYPTKDEAFVSFLRRKKKQLAILAAQHDAVVALIALAEANGAKDGFVHVSETVDDFDFQGLHL